MADHCGGRYGRGERAEADVDKESGRGVRGLDGCRGKKSGRGVADNCEGRYGRGERAEADEGRESGRGVRAVRLTNDMTIFSLNGSMGGLVTCAKSCLKYS